MAAVGAAVTPRPKVFHISRHETVRRHALGLQLDLVQQRPARTPVHLVMNRVAVAELLNAIQRYVERDAKLAEQVRDAVAAAARALAAEGASSAGPKGTDS